MSYSNTELRAAFDGMIMFASPIIASFKASAVELLSSLNLTGTIDECATVLQELEQSPEFGAFKDHYGEAAGQLVLKIAASFNQKFNAKEDEVEYGLEPYINFKANGFSLDEQLPILEHWIKTQSSHFVSHLQEYPEILSFIRNNTDFETDAILDAPQNYLVSYQSFAEYCASRNTDEQSRHFFESDQHTLAGMLGMLALMQKQGALDVYRDKDFILESPVATQKEDRRQQKRANGAEQALKIIVAVRRERIAQKVVDRHSTPDQITEYNQAALELAILEGKRSFKMVVPGQLLKERVKVLDLIGVDVVNMTPLQKLEVVDNVESLKEARATKLAGDAIRDLEARKEALGDIGGDRYSKKAQKYAVFSKGIAILNRSPTYVAHPNIDAAGNISIHNTSSEVDIQDCSATKRLELFHHHYKDNETLFSGGALEKLSNFVKIIKNFVNKKLDEVMVKRAVVQEPRAATNFERKTHKDETKLSEVAAALFLKQSLTVMPLPGAGNIHGIKPPTVA